MVVVVLDGNGLFTIFLLFYFRTVLFSFFLSSFL